jgi:hypothetical protein
MEEAGGGRGGLGAAVKLLAVGLSQFSEFCKTCFGRAHFPLISRGTAVMSGGSAKMTSLERLAMAQEPQETGAHLHWIRPRWRL